MKDERQVMIDRLEELNINELFEISEVDTRFKRLISKFVYFLRNEGFIISGDAVLKFFELYSEFDVFKIDDMKYSLKMLFCKNKEQYNIFDSCFEAYFYGVSSLRKDKILEDEVKKVGSERVENLKDIKRQKEIELTEYETKARSDIQKIITQVNTKNQKITSEKNKFIKESEENMTSIKGTRRRKEEGEDSLKEWFNENKAEVDSLVSNVDLKDIGVKKEDIMDIFTLSQETMLDVLVNRVDSKFNGVEIFSKALNDIMLENMLNENNSDINNLCIVALSILVKSKKLIDKRVKNREVFLEELNQQIHAENARIDSLNMEIKKKEKEMIKKIEECEREISNTSKDIEKEIISQHREFFLEGKNSVRLLNPQYELLDEKIQRLSNVQYKSLSEVIKANASKFKTKISRSMKKDKSKKFNYRKTLQNSMKTYGVPMELCYEKPKVKKTKIVCILDVSGSCSKAAKVLLRFIYELSTVFKGGVKSYAFVGDLADISYLFVDYDIDTASEMALRSVPRVYSNYYRALSIFDSEYLGEVDKNTIVIFLGDARNNKNKPGVEFLEKIQSKAKSVFWLNTEEKAKWDVKDSIIGLYSRYLNDVKEVLTTNDIIDFLESIKID